MSNNEFNYHLRFVVEHAEKHIATREQVEVDFGKLQKKHAALEKVVKALPNAEQILAIADKVRKGIPLFSHDEITQIQTGLRDYAIELREQLNSEIGRLSKIIGEK